MFNVIVGPETNQQKFRLHRDLFVQRSEFFRAARSEEWVKEKPRRPTYLEHENPAVFEAYVHVVYRGRIRVKGLEMDESGLFERNDALEEDFATDNDTTKPGMLYGRKTEDRYLMLMKLNVLARFLLDHKTTNLVIDETIRTRDLVGNYPGYDAIDFLYGSTIEGDCMRRLLAGYYVEYANPKYFDPKYRKYHFPRESLEEVTFGLMKSKQDEILDRKVAFRPAYYIANWNPSQGQYKYHWGPGTEGDALPDSDDEDPDYDDEAVMTDDEMVE
jgi:hypothetical protein